MVSKSLGASQATGLGSAEAPEPHAGLGPTDAIPRAVDLTALSYWFPVVEAAGLPVPQTRILRMLDSVQTTIFTHLWGDEADPTEVKAFVEELRLLAAPLGAPFFLRTDHTSGKHHWNDMCFVADPAALTKHVYGIAEFSEMAGFPGLPWGVWVAREMLPTKPFGVCPFYEGMPVCKEFRFFVDGSAVECFHPYWPRHALEQGGCDLSDAEYAALCDPGNVAELSALASRAGAALGGRWSVDLLDTKRGWFLTDMAEADKSFHWEDCPAIADRNAKRQDAEERLGPQDESGGGAANRPETIAQNTAASAEQPSSAQSSTSIDARRAQERK